MGVGIELHGTRIHSCMLRRSNISGIVWSRSSLGRHWSALSSMAQEFNLFPSILLESMHCTLCGLPVVVIQRLTVEFGVALKFELSVLDIQCAHSVDCVKNMDIGVHNKYRLVKSPGFPALKK